jgi:tetratricopeptide (TPR) repeat protein
MNKATRILLLVLLGASLAGLPACRSAREPVATARPDDPPQPVSERAQVESSALLVDAIRQKNLGNWSQAVVLFYEAVQRDPLNDAALFELSKIHAMQGEFADALKYAQQTVRIDPDNPFYQMLLADVYILSDRLPQAISIYENLAGENPDNIDFHYHLANAYIHNQQYHSALAVLEHIEEIIGFSEELSLQKQKILIQTGEYERAIDEAERLLAIFPDEPMFYELLGELYTETGQAHKALEIYERLLEVDPGNPVAFLLIADYHQTQGDTLRAYEYLKEAFRSPALGAEPKARILYSYYMLSEQDEYYLEQALELCSILIEVHPGDPEAYLIYGDFLNREDRLEEARDMFLKGAMLDPSNLEVWQQVLVLDHMLGDFEAMRVHSDQALEYFFEQPLIFLFNGIANMVLKQYEDAASSLEYGLGLVTGDAELREQFLTMLGDAHYYLGSHQRSDSYYEEAIRLNPRNATALNNYSYHLAERGLRLDEAEAMSRLALELEAGNAAFMDTYGWIMYKKGQYEEARHWIEKSLNADDERSGVVLEHFGDVLYKLGQKDQALRYWEEALETGDGSDLLEQKVKNRTLYE